MILEPISAVVILVIAIVFLNPGHLTMPNNLQSMLILGLILSFFTFAAFIYKERSLDEREASHIQMAGRISYLVGIGILICGVIVQSISHNIDPWLIYALCAMIFSKLVSRIYSRYHR